MFFFLEKWPNSFPKPYRTRLDPVLGTLDTLPRGNMRIMKKFFLYLFMAGAFKPKFKKLPTFRAPVLLSRRLKILRIFSKKKWSFCLRTYNPLRKWKIVKQQQSCLPATSFGQRRLSRLKKRYGLILRFKQRCRFFYKVKDFSKFRRLALKAKNSGWSWKSPPSVYFQHLLESNLSFSLGRLGLVRTSEFGTYMIDSKKVFGAQAPQPFSPFRGHNSLERSKLLVSSNYSLKGGELMSFDLNLYSFLMRHYLRVNNSRLRKKKRRLAFKLWLRKVYASYTVLDEKMPHNREIFYKWSELDYFLGYISKPKNKALKDPKEEKVFEAFAKHKIGAALTHFSVPMLQKLEYVVQKKKTKAKKLRLKDQVRSRKSKKFG